MGFFSKSTEADALKKIDYINREMREISASIHLNYNMIDGRNRADIRSHYNNIISYIRSYERIKSELQDYERGMLLGTMVDVWNGERVGVFTWEIYLSNSMEWLKQELNY